MHRAVFDARSARCDVRSVAAVFVGADETEERCSAISSCRSAGRTSGTRLLRRRSQRRNASARSSSPRRGRDTDTRSSDARSPVAASGAMPTLAAHVAESFHVSGGVRFATIADGYLSSARDFGDARGQGG